MVVHDSHRGLEGLAKKVPRTLLLEAAHKVVRGGCVKFDGFGELVLGNTTLKNCTSQQGPYIWVGGRGTRFRAELLTLEPNCEAEHNESLIYADWAPEEANAFPVHVQGLQVSDGCASSSLVVNGGDQWPAFLTAASAFTSH